MKFRDRRVAKFHPEPEVRSSGERVAQNKSLLQLQSTVATAIGS